MKNKEKDFDFSEEGFKKRFKQINRAKRPKEAIEKAVRESQEKEIFAVCLKTDNAERLIPFKIYRIALRGEFARVIDEKGETAAYPKDFFLPLQLPTETADALISAYTQIS